jgi:ATP-dependent DNA helicase RecG
MSPDLIERFGVGAGTRYALSARVQAALGAAGAYTRERGLARTAQQDLILQHARQFGRVDNQAVRQILQVTRMEATNQLRSLEQRGLIVMHGSRRWAYYEPIDQQTLPM